MTMTDIAVVELTYRGTRKAIFFAWDSLVILAFYIFALSVLSMRR